VIKVKIRFWLSLISNCKSIKRFTFQ
jgi:hypothetical protein